MHFFETMRNQTILPSESFSQFYFSSSIFVPQFPNFFCGFQHHRFSRVSATPLTTIFILSKTFVSHFLSFVLFSENPAKIPSKRQARGRQTAAPPRYFIFDFRWKFEKFKFFNFWKYEFETWSEIPKLAAARISKFWCPKLPKFPRKNLAIIRKKKARKILKKILVKFPARLLRASPLKFFEFSFLSFYQFLFSKIKIIFENIFVGGVGGEFSVVCGRPNPRNVFWTNWQNFKKKSSRFWEKFETFPRNFWRDFWERAEISSGGPRERFTNFWFLNNNLFFNISKLKIVLLFCAF